MRELTLLNGISNGIESSLRELNIGLSPVRAQQKKCMVFFAEWERFKAPETAPKLVVKHYPFLPPLRLELGQDRVAQTLLDVLKTSSPHKAITTLNLSSSHFKGRNFS